MKKIIKFVGIAAAGFAVLLLVAGIAAQLLFGGYAKEAAVKAINERLESELVIGDIGFSVFSHFPYASVDLTGVELKEGIPGSSKPLLVAEKISAQFNVMSLWYGDYTVQRVRVENAKLFTAIDKAGKGNYFVFKKSSDAATGAQVKIEKIILVNVDIEHTDLHNNQSYALLVNEATASGDFSAGQFTTDVTADLLVRNALVDGISCLQNKPATLKLGLYMDLEKELYKFNECELAVSEASFTLTGLVARVKTGYDLNLALKGNDIGLEELGSLMPEEYYRHIRGITTDGDLTCRGTVKGVMGKKQNPSVEFAFGIKNGTVEHDGEAIESVNLSAVYTNGNVKQRSWNASTLRVPQGSVVFNGTPFTFSLDLNRFDNPFVALNLNGTVDLASVKPLLGLHEDASLTGSLQLVNFEYRGAAGALRSKNTVATQSSGTLVFKDVNYSSGEAAIDGLNATLVSDGNNLALHECRANIGESDVSVSGNVNNMIPGLLIGFDKTQLHVNLTVVSENVNAKDFVFEVSGRDSTTTATAWWKNISGKALVNVARFKQNEFTATEMQMRLEAADGLVRFNGLQLSALGGSLMADGTCDLRKQDVTVLETTLACKNVDVNRMFNEFSNFSQDAITADNLDGILATRCYLKAVWRHGVFQNNELVAVADVNIDKGELKRFEPMYAMSKYAKVSDLENIRFSRLSNQIEIRNGVIQIPTTTIRS
ncbi:MAG TPA: AsmA family protein, partial [Chitinophagales bacterium]|nr:AsmA family protein [Chitinophagales bacterium]